MIQAARDLVDLQIPMIGVNMGSLGYLTQIARGEALSPMLDALLKDHFRLERRMMLEGAVVRQDKDRTRGMTLSDCPPEEGKIDAGAVKYGIALNDIVFTRRDVMQVLKFQVYVNGELLNEYTADGMIVATPTGSTAYNLSAGGPIVTPGAKLMVLTPICSHSINSRSIILSHQDEIGIRVLKNVEDIGICTLTSSDVVRHPLVQKIVKAYEEYEKHEKKGSRSSKRERGRAGKSQRFERP